MSWRAGNEPNLEEAHEHAHCNTPVFDWWSFPGIPPYCRLEGPTRAAQISIQTTLGVAAVWICNTDKAQVPECVYQRDYVVMFGVGALVAVVLQVSFGVFLHLVRKPKALTALQSGLGFGPPTRTHMKTTRFELWAQYMCCVITPCLLVPAMGIKAVVGFLRSMSQPSFSDCEALDTPLYMSYFVVAAVLGLVATNIFGLCLAFTVCYRRLNRGMRQRDKELYGGEFQDEIDSEDDDRDEGGERQPLITSGAIQISEHAVYGDEADQALEGVQDSEAEDFFLANIATSQNGAGRLDGMQGLSEPEILVVGEGAGQDEGTQMNQPAAVVGENEVDQAATVYQDGDLGAGSEVT